MHKRLLIIARDFNEARHWAQKRRLSPGQWIYASSYHNIRGNAGSEYVLLGEWAQRVDSSLLLSELKEHGCTEQIRNSVA